MTSRCGDEEELLRLLDGELTENEAERLRQHLRACGVCAARSAELARTLRDLKAPLAEVDPDAAIEEVMRRLPTAVADASAVAARPRVARWSLLAGGLAAVLAMSALVVTRRVPRGQEGDGFQARGTSAGTSIGRAVGVGLYRAAREHEALAQETRVRPDDAYGMRYRNLLAEPVYLLAFAIDAAGTVHWVSPAYLDPRSNPAAVALSPSREELPLPSAIELEAPSPGPMRFVAIVSPSALHVLDVDGLRGADLETTSLRARWPAADVRDLVTVNVDSSP
jgi:Putative zinc-finger